MGIHLGDIFLTESDVMGDGVNIAARLQSEAEPGGICISQTVYDVVKNKLAIKAVSLGPRELKNIREAIYAYRIVVDAETNQAEKAAPVRSGRRFPLYWLLAAAAACVVIAVVLNAARQRRSGEPLLPPAPQESPTVGAAPPPGDLRSTTIEWIRPRLVRHGRENPLRVRSTRMSGDMVRAGRSPLIFVWMEGDDIMLDVRGDVRRRSFDQLDRRIIGAIAAELSREARMPGGDHPPTRQQAVGDGE